MNSTHFITVVFLLAFGWRALTHVNNQNGLTHNESFRSKGDDFEGSWNDSAQHNSLSLPGHVLLHSILFLSCTWLGNFFYLWWMQRVCRPSWDSLFRQQISSVYTFMWPYSKSQWSINIPLKMIKLKVNIVLCGKWTLRKAMCDFMFFTFSFSCTKEKQLNSKMLLSMEFNKKIYSALCDFRRQMESCLAQDVVWQICRHKEMIIFSLGKWVLRQWNVKPGQPILLDACSVSLTLILMTIQRQVCRHLLPIWNNIRIVKHLLWIWKQI